MTMTDAAEYRSFYEAFDASLLTDALRGDLATGINACVECCDRHVGENKVAVHW